MTPEALGLVRAAAERLRVMVVGSLNMDTLLQIGHFPETDSAMIVNALDRCPGGHAGNCAAALAALGATVRITAMVGRDADGDALISDLVEGGVDASDVRRSARSATGQVFIPTAGAQHYMLLWRGANDDLALDLAEAVEAFAPAALVAFDPPAAVLRQLPGLRALKAPPSVYWCPGPVNARNPGGIAASLAEAVDVVLVNGGERADLDAAVGTAGVRELVTTRGAGGAECRIGGTTLSAPVGSVEVVDTVGSGDAFLSAYVVAREAGLAVPERLGFANAYAGLAATGRGARGGLAPLDRLLDAIERREAVR